MSDVVSSSNQDGSSSSFANPDVCTETSSQNYFERLAGSLVAAVLGIVLFFVAIGLLAWNESRAVDAVRGLAQAAKETVEVSPAPIDSAQNTKLVHLTGNLKANGPLSDPAVGFSPADIVRLKRTVEMYQWTETKQTSSGNQLGGTETKRTTYSYSRKWSENPIDSSRFNVQDHHRNPSMPMRTKMISASDATIGPRIVTVALLDNLDAFEPAEPAPVAAPDGFVQKGRVLYKGNDPDAPAVGDLRISFATVPAQQVSVVAQQRGAALAPFHARNGYKIALVAAGDQTAGEMIAAARSKEKALTWVLRAAGFVLFFVSLLMMAAPLSALGNVVPVIASIIGGGVTLFAFALSIPLTLATIAIAWMAVRPLFGIGLLVAAAVLVYAYQRIVPRRRARPAPMAADPMPAA